MKETILNTSLKLFTQHGFKSITMDDIAKELGISKKTIYQHFASKTDLVKATIDYVFDAANEQMKKIVQTCESPIHEHFLMRTCVGDLFGHNIKASTIYQFNKYYPKLAERIQKKRQADYDFTVVRNLKEGVAKGYYRKDIDIDFIGKLFFTTHDNFYNDESFSPMQNSQSVAELNYKLLEYHLRAIVTPKGLEILEKLLKTHLTNEI